METRIMIVDNWPYSLECIRWLVKDEPYRCFGYSDTSKALEMLGGTEFAVVLAEQSMPQISGIRFLKQVKARSPETVRIIMSGHLETDTAVEAIKSGDVFLFIKKPLEGQKFRETVGLAIDQHRLNVAIRKVWRGYDIAPTSDYQRI